MIRTVIGIDPGQHTGIAVLTHTDVRLKTLELGPPPMGPRLRTLWDLYSVAIGSDNDSLLVVYEEPARMQGAAGMQIQQYLGVLRLWCEIHEVQSYPVNQSTLKGWVRRTRNITGKMDKDAMIAAAVREGAEPKDDNQADAYWLARYGREVVAPVIF
jgi:Holliday junction resolvasome RuvABC endonuclease subunit